MILAAVIFAALVYFNVDLRSIVGGFLENPIIQKVWHIFIVAWVSFIKPLLVYLVASIVGLFN